MSAHTPGPWQVRKIDPRSVAIPDEHGKLIVLAPSEADARLIAAAPDLLAALEEIVEAADGSGWDQIDATLKKQRAAIAKARGYA